MPFTSQEIGINKDVLHYEKNGSRGMLSIYPRLGSYMPDLEGVEIKFRESVKAPEALSYTRGGMVRLEISNEWYCIYVVGIAGGLMPVEPGIQLTNYQFFAIVTNATGKVIFTTVGEGDMVLDMGESFSRYALAKMDFNNLAKPVDQKNLVTKIEPINEQTMTRKYSASAILGGGIIYTLANRDAKEIWDAKMKPDSNFSFWKRGFSWTKGDLVAFIGEDFTTNYHIAIFNRNGMQVAETRSTWFQSAVDCASNYMK